MKPEKIAEWLTRDEIFKLRAAIRKILVDYKDLVFSEIRIDKL